MSFIRDLIVALLASEAMSYLPWLRIKILKIAVALLPFEQRAIRFEEWQAVLLDFELQGEFSRTVLTFGFLRAGIVYRSTAILRRLTSFCVTGMQLGIVLWAVIWMSREKRCVFFAMTYVEYLKSIVVDQKEGRLSAKKAKNMRKIVNWMDKRVSSWVAEFAPKSRTE